MLIIFSLITILYISFVFLLMVGWVSIKLPKKKEGKPVMVTVIIAARNEAQHLPTLLSDLSHQHYMNDLYEIIVVDDNSEDETETILNQYQQSGDIKLKVLKNISNSFSPKKEAIGQGIKLAEGELIVITDADCRVGNDWLTTLVEFYTTTDAKFIAGPVKYDVLPTCVGMWLQIEFASLIGTGAAAMFWNKPVMCNAANIAFPKEVFLEIGGFAGNEDQASGDDVFLMHKIYARYPERVRFLKLKEAIVSTAPVSTFMEFLHQRIRWAAKWKNAGAWYNKLLPLFIFTYHFLTIMTLLMVVAGTFNLRLWIVLFVVKFIAEYLFLKSVMSFFSAKGSVFDYLGASILYPFYAVFFGIAANINTFKWKGRKY